MIKKQTKKDTKKDKQLLKRQEAIAEIEALGASKTHKDILKKSL